MRSWSRFPHDEITAFIRRGRGFPGGSEVKNLPAMQEIQELITGSGRSPGRRNGNPLQYSYLENLMDRRAWRATVHGVAKSQAQHSNWECKKRKRPELALSPPLTTHQVRTQQKGGCPQASKRALTRNQIGWHFDLGLSSLQNCEKLISAV